MKAGSANTEGVKGPLLLDAREGWIVFTIFALAFGLRLYLVFHTYLISNDGILYVRLAKLISQGEFEAALSIAFFNLYPLITALFQKVFSDWELSGQMVSAVFGSLTVIPFYFLIKSLFNRTAATISSILFVFHPYLVRFSAEVVREPTFWFFLMMALWVGWEAISRKRAWMFPLTGFLGVVSFVLRAEGIVVVPIIGAWVLLKDRRTFRRTYGQRLLFVMVLLVTVLIVGSPAMLLLRQKTGHWNWARAQEIPGLAFSDITMKSIKTNFDRIEIEPWDNTSEGQLELIRLKAFLSLAKENRLGIIGLEMASKFVKAIHPMLLILLAFGIIKRKKVQYREKQELFLLSIMAVFLMVIARYATVNPYVGTRHMMVPVILCLAWTGIGLVELEHRIKDTSLMAKSNRNRRSHGFMDPRWLLLILVVLFLLPKTLASQRMDKIPIREAGVWIKEHGPKNPVVMGQGELARIGFYGDGTFLEIPRNEDLYEYLKRGKVDFLAINEKNIEDTHPGLIDSLDSERFEKEVVLGMPSGQYVIIIYSVRS